MTENWERWEPLSDLCKKYYVEKIVDDSEGLEIILFSDGEKRNKLSLRVEQVYAYMVTEETFRVKLFGDLREKYGPDFHGNWTFFKVNNSEYIKWIDTQSGTIATIWSSDENPIQHFCVMAADETIDIIVYGAPKIKFLT